MQLVKELEEIPLTPTLTANGVTLAGATRLIPGYYIIFADPSNVDFDAVLKAEPPLPGGIEIDFIPVRLRTGQSIHDAVAIYRMEAEGKPLIFDNASEHLKSHGE